MEALLDEVSFSADERSGQTITVDRAMVEEKLDAIVENEDVTRYIL
jgi:ATP-dependent HslUV protease ATP-binding subunit HslU